MGDKIRNSTICIVGAGRSLCGVPRDYVFPCDTMALNVSTIAPQFYDMKEEKFHHSWTYGVFIDSRIKNKSYFPEYYYYTKSLENTEGKLLLPLKNSYWDQYSQPNVVQIDIKSAKMVLIPAMRECMNRGYKNVILVGCDFCRMEHFRYWWEDDDLMLNHPINQRAFVKAVHEEYTELSSGKVRISKRDHPGQYIELNYTEDTGGNKVLYEPLYQKQIDQAMEMVGLMRGSGIKIFKLFSKGMLDLEGIELSELEGLGRRDEQSVDGGIADETL